MRVLVPSLVLSIFSVCFLGAKVGIQNWDKQLLKMGVVAKTNIALTWILFFINILLVVFSILGNEIALQILLSLGSGALILYQVSFSVQFFKKLC
jgi:hypothetical protein